MANLPPPAALILVAVLPQPRDLEIARLLGWYRIPFRHAPKVVDVDYLAFYQPGTFGEQHRWQVAYFAEVRGHELTTRAELLRDEPDHPHAHEEYYKIQLGNVEALPKPIQAGEWKRITFLYTTGAQLAQAQALRDLVVRTEERAILWSSLRERALTAGSYQPPELPEEAIEPALLALLGGFNHLAETSQDYQPD